ncbi:MAG: hypothetical protein QOH77_1601, partial [Actinomycetota bacterium]|nr:hypothetical protein [Actinomycetota bacterium]
MDAIHIRPSQPSRIFSEWGSLFSVTNAADVMMAWLGARVTLNAEGSVALVDLMPILFVPSSQRSCTKRTSPIIRRAAAFNTRRPPLSTRRVGMPRPSALDR